jgi:SAM-dependent methyltransferase
MPLILKKIYWKFEKIFIRKPFKTKFFYKYFPRLFLWAKFSQTKNKNTGEFWDAAHSRENETGANRFENFALSFLDKIYFKDKDILDIGCGRGIFLSQIPGARSKTGVDISAEAVKIAAGRGINALVRKLPEINLDDNFDIITCFETLEHTFAWKKSILEMMKLLRKDGFLIISVPFEDSILIGEHVSYFDLPRLCGFLRKKLSVLEIKIPGPWLLVIAQNKKYAGSERPEYFFKTL